MSKFTIRYSNGKIKWIKIGPYFVLGDGTYFLTIPKGFICVDKEDVDLDTRRDVDDFLHNFVNR